MFSSDVGWDVWYEGDIMHVHISWKNPVIVCSLLEWGMGMADAWNRIWDGESYTYTYKSHFLFNKFQL